MAAVILWKQQRKRDVRTESNKILKWLKAVISLTVVMGLTWIIGVLIVEREELLPLAYIYTIMVAFQGFFIFLVLIVFTKSVRDEVSKRTAFKLQKFRAKYSEVRNFSVQYLVYVFCAIYSTDKHYSSIKSNVCEKH